MISFIKFIFLTVLAFAVLCGGYFYLDPQGAKDAYSYVRNISFTEIKSQIMFSFQDESSQYASENPYWVEFKNAENKLSFKHPPTETDIIEHKVNPYSVTIYFPDTIAEKVSRSLTAAVFNAEYCDYIGGEKRMYDNREFRFFSEKIPDQNSVLRSFMAYTIENEKCYLFEMKYSKAKTGLSDTYGLNTDFGLNYEEQNFFEAMMETVKIWSI